MEFSLWPSSACTDTVLAVDRATPPGNNTGGVPSNPAVESAEEAGAAIQAIVTVNVTTTNELELLLAGLLDNTTGGVNGAFETVTGEVPFLGLEGAVMDALANGTVVTSGLYGAPTGAAPTPTPSGSGVWGWLWNAPGEVVETVVHGVETLVSITWTAAVAATTYFDHLAREAAALAGTLLARSATALATAGKVVEGALTTAYRFVLDEMSGFFSGIAQGLASGFVRALAGWSSTLFLAANFTVAAFDGQNVSANEAKGSEALNSALVTPFLIAAALATATYVLIALATPFEIGPSELVSVLLPLLLTAFAAALASAPGFGFTGLLLSKLTGGIPATLEGFDTVAQWMFNETHSIGSAAASDAVVPGASGGDFWSFLVVVLSTVGMVGSLGSYYLLAAASPPLEQIGTTGYLQTAGVLQDATIALLFSLLALLLVVLEYLVSFETASWTGLERGAATVGEMALAILAVLWSAIAGGTGVVSLLKNEELPDGVEAAGGLGVVFSAAAVYFGLSDAYGLAVS